jgi:hypothetical protein
MARVFRTIWLSLLIIWSAAGIARSAAFYVSPSGQDTNTGTSPAAAWQTIIRANNQILSPGDQLFFQGGMTFSGTIYFGPFAGGTAGSPVLISSYGAGRATISGVKTNGLYAYNCAGLVISNLNFVGAGRTTNQNSGIEFYNDGGGAAHLLNLVRVSQVDVGGFGYVGVVLGGWNGTNGYNDVRLTDVDAHDNGSAGIQTYAQYSRVNTNVYAGHCRAWNNSGTIAQPGGGIFFGQVNNAVIERCVAWTNGWLGDIAIGIWTFDSTRVTIQFCESHHNRTTGGQDGGGFDLDGGVTFSALQYNYSHDNDGAGYALYENLGDPPHSNNVVRFNISQNDGRRNSCAGLQLANAGDGIGESEIYNNTIYTSSAASGTPRAIYFQTAVTNVHLRNNLFVTSGGLRLVEGPSGQTGVLFQGNDYWSSSNTFAIKWGSSTYASLAAWRTATGLERIGTTNVGLSVDPRLVSPGGGTTVGNPDLLGTLTAYQLQTYSPLREAGLDLPALFGVNVGATDYYNNPLPNGLTFDIGAQDARVEATLVSAAVEAGHFSASYLRSSPVRADLLYSAQLSSDLINWCENCALPSSTNNLGNGTESVKLVETAPTGGTQPRFLRLRVTRAP